MLRPSADILEDPMGFRQPVTIDRQCGTAQVPPPPRKAAAASVVVHALEFYRAVGFVPISSPANDEDLRFSYLQTQEKIE
jgi:hypothetical protein